MSLALDGVFGEFILDSVKYHTHMVLSDWY